MVEFIENKWTHRAKKEKLEKKFSKNWEDIHTWCVHGEYWVYWNVPGEEEIQSDQSYFQFVDYLESSDFDFSQIWVEAKAKEDEEIQIKLYGSKDDNIQNNQYPSLGDLNYFANHRLLIFKTDGRYCIFHTKIRPSDLLLENIIKNVEMPQDINLPLGEEHSILYLSESNMKPEFIEETYYIYYTNQQLSNNFNDEVLILTDKIKHEHFYNESSDRFEEYRSFENIDDALEMMYQILNKKK